MPVIHLMHGFVGAGKTTFSKKLENETGAVRYSPDEWMRSRHGENPPEEKFAEYLAGIKQDIIAEASNVLSGGRDVIFDYGFWSYKERESYRNFARTRNIPFKLYYIYADDQVMEDRVLKRTEEMPEGQVFIDKNAIELFRTKFEKLRDDEERITIKTG